MFNQAVTGFTAVNLPLTDANNNMVYTWTNRVAINGSIQVLTSVPPVNTTPTNITVHASGGNLDAILAFGSHRLDTSSSDKHA